MTPSSVRTCSVVLNIHREGKFLTKTLRSIDAAAARIRSEGVAVELVAVFDHADDVTRRAFAACKLESFDATQILEVANGSLGLSRNDGVRAATGEFIFLADADDLISTDYFSATLECDALSSVRTLFFPEFMLGFGDQYYVTRYANLDETGIEAFISVHPYISRVAARRELFAELAFSDFRLSQGYAYEDWHFNCEAVAAGYDMQVVPGIVLFYRQRAGSLLRSANAMSARQIGPSALFRPSCYIERCDAWHGRTRASDKPPIDDRLRALREALMHPRMQDEIKLAHKIEPQISISRFEDVPLSFNDACNTETGRAYYEAAQILGDTVYTDVFFLPFLSKGGGEKFVIQVIEVICRLDPEAEVLIICGEPYAGPSAESSLPLNVTVLNLPLIDPRLGIDERCLIAWKAIERSEANLRVHFTCSLFSTTMLTRYSKLLKAFRCYFYRFNNVEKMQHGRLNVIFTPLNLIREHIALFESVICDSAVMRGRDIEVVPEHAHKWHVLRAHVTASPAHPAQAFAASSAPDPGRRPLKVLWASRFDEQKRPELLALIAERILADSLPIQIDAYGFSVFSEHHSDNTSHAPALRYRGPFKRFADLPLGHYDTFLYTSWNDGVPNVLLEAGAARLPIIAPDVGGISEVVRDNETGVLLASLEDDQAMADAYVRVLRRFLADPACHRRMGDHQADFLSVTFGLRQHEETVQRLLGLTPRNRSIEKIAAYRQQRAIALRQHAVLEKSWLTRTLPPLPVHQPAAQSRAHAMAQRYITFAEGDSAAARVLAVTKKLLKRIRRVLRR